VTDRISASTLDVSVVFLATGSLGGTTCSTT
jgi:hypothetical protein